MDVVLLRFQSPEKTVTKQFPQRPVTSCYMVFGEYISGSMFALEGLPFNIVQYFGQHLVLFLGLIFSVVS